MNQTKQKEKQGKKQGGARRCKTPLRAGRCDVRRDGPVPCGTHLGTWGERNRTPSGWEAGELARSTSPGHAERRRRENKNRNISFVS